MLSFLLRVLAIILYFLFWFMIGWMLGYGITTMAFKGAAKAARKVEDDFLVDAVAWEAK